MKFTGIRYGGNPPDSGNAYVDGKRIAAVPVDLVKHISQQQWSLLLAAYEDIGRPLTRSETRAAVDA